MNQPPDHSSTATTPRPQRVRRVPTLIAAVLIGVALFGFLVGLREPPLPSRPEDPPSSDHSVPPAAAYSELPTAMIRPNVGWNRSLSQLQYDRPDIFTPVVRTEEMKLAALADRARNRAFDGAPPTIPHAVSTASANGCLACHGEGLKVGDRVASKMSHAMMTNCTQCHVEQSPTPAESDFVGLYRSGPGVRANPAAPPTIPHHTWMRENCNSCHGLVTRPGIRTTHPWLTHCTQCHVPSAVLDQVDFNKRGKR